MEQLNLIFEFEETELEGYGYCESGNIYSRKRGEWQKLTPSLSGNGYLKFNLKIGEAYKSVYLHDLVCLAFMGEKPDGKECRHLDGNKLNNHPSNLRYGTRAENQADRLRHGTDSRGEKHRLAKLTVDKVRAIRERAASGETQRSIARAIGISYQTVSSIICGRSWAWLV